MDKSSTMLVHYDKGTPAVANEIKEALEGNDVEAKVDAMKKAIMLLLNGETIPQLFITIIRYVLPSEDHTIQKLLLLYLELIEKTERSMQIKANIKVSSTETGVIFGNIVYETSNVMERNVVVLNDIHIDIMDYISPAVCSEVAFRTMWAEFEWENKVAVNTTIQNEREFLDHIIKSTNMKCLTAPSAIAGECGFLAANLYAKSVFGEDALVNLSIEKQTDGTLSGYIRIRSKTQGIALSLGDKITLKQKGGS